MSYVYKIGETPLTDTTQWKASAGTAAKGLFDGLESGKHHSCRIAAIGPPPANRVQRCDDPHCGVSLCAMC